MTPTRRQLEAETLDRLSKSSRQMRTAFDAAVAEHGLTLARARALLRLDCNVAPTQRDLAADLSLEGATVVRILDVMEKQGLLRRRSVEGDRRAKHVVLTPAGTAKARMVEATATRLRSVFLEGAADADLEACLRVLGVLTQNIAATAEEAADDDRS